MVETLSSPFVPVIKSCFRHFSL